MPNSAPCDDGDVCTTGDVCIGGACASPLPLCDDGNPCTVDTCYPGEGCGNSPAPFGAPCDGASGVCDLAGKCVTFTATAFSAETPPVQDLQMSLFGVRELGGAPVAVGGAWEVSALGTIAPAFTMGYVFRLDTAPPELAYNTPAPLTAIDHTIAVGWDATVIRSTNGAWKLDSTMGELLPPPTPLDAVLTTYDGVTGDLGSRTLLGFDGTLQYGGLAECYGPQSCSVFQNPSGLTVVGLGAVTVVDSVDAPFSIDTTARFALVDGPESAGIWSEATGADAGPRSPPWGCQALDQTSPCGGVVQWRDIAGIFANDTCAVGADGAAPVLLCFLDGAWERIPVDAPPEVAQLDIEALATSKDHIFAVGEAVGCGTAACAGDPSWRARVLLHMDPEGIWSQPVVLGAHQCATPDDPAACQGDLDQFRVRDMVWTTGADLVVVGSTLDTSVAPPGPAVLTYAAPVGAPFTPLAVCGNGTCDAHESCSTCPNDCGLCGDGTCTGSCGGPSPLGCWCDPGCETSGDCCADACETCGVGCPL